MKKSIPKVQERESEASFLGNDREREFPLTPDEDGDGGSGEDDNKVEEGGQVLLRCNPGGACLKNGCTWTFPGMRNKI